ncbi:hypothetical protein TTHERM_01243460 (macronuclear) [Tetrahymena thermophila SB210]|uniref:Uncharacterized protein n=1 Tax=Tetrahymena thermophila (strain SB210) TaxID=312017 RepID=Q24BS6_TETTS|nr:hypothetical protein TTHERM_01243460 [Tetrahymena thermophila SB210]EAS05232.2 hypothetical protein TTHERM_01243460 [Tetrahymena thermophila SB210]|eukprot:XP_001025477.2 hypothetical protein TTHERM_01243460 [Tetrahymena thermophila SB210]
MDQSKLRYISQGHYNLVVDCSDIDSSILIIKEKLQAIKTLTLSFERISIDKTLKLKTIGPNVKNLVPIISQINELGLVLDLDSHDQNLFDFVGLIKRIHHLTLDIHNTQSAELALSLLKMIALENLNTFQLDLFRACTNNKNFHKNILLIVFKMINLQSLSLNFDFKEEFPEQNELVFPKLINFLFIKGEGTGKIESLKHLTIPNLNFVKLHQLTELESLKITNQITENTLFEDFCYLSSLKTFKITRQINEEAKFLNRIKYLPKDCVVQLSTYYLGHIQSLGQIKDIFLDIQNNGCIGSYEKNIEEKIREACNLTPIIERNLALNTDISFFNTDFKISEHFKVYINQRGINMLKLIAYRKFISPSLLTNPSLCFFDLTE